MNINATHDPELVSWVDSANSLDTEFPIQNLPFGRFKLASEDTWKVGVAIGTMVLDLQATGLVRSHDIRDVISLKPLERAELRSALSSGLQAGSSQEARWSAFLFQQSDVELGLPCDTRDYTDFYIGIHHATAVGKLFRPDNPLLPNYKHLPIGYHGRASSIIPSGTSFARPMGQLKSAQDLAPRLAPCERLDFELEMGVIIGRSSELGAPISLQEAENHIAGLTLFNDWSARDIQSWEYQPLGPFLSKSFASTISPWIVTLDALAPFRSQYHRPEGDPPLLSYLDDPVNQDAGAFDIDLEVLLQTRKMRREGLEAECISRSNFSRAAYWTAAQLVVQQTLNGCNLATGDLLGTGTLSGLGSDQAGSLLELSNGGRQPYQLLSGEQRTFLEDGDIVSLRGRCARSGFRTIGFGECTGEILG